MSSKKLTKKQLKEKRARDDKKFKRIARNILLGMFLIMLFLNVFVAFWCDIKFTYNRLTLYGEKVPANEVCMNADKLEYEESIEFTLKNKLFYACSGKCKQRIIQNYKKNALVTDAFSGDTICKADALIGLKEQDKPDVVYFKNIKNFNNYYAKKN